MRPGRCLRRGCPPPRLELRPHDEFLRIQILFVPKLVPRFASLRRSGELKTLRVQSRVENVSTSFHSVLAKNTQARSLPAVHQVHRFAQEWFRWFAARKLLPAIQAFPQHWQTVPPGPFS